MDNRRLFLAALLSLGVLVLWQWMFAPPQPVAPRDSTEGIEAPASSGPLSPEPGRPTAGEAAAESADSGTAAGSGEPVAEGPPIVASLEQTVRLETERFVAVLTNRGGQLRSFVLKGQRRADGELVDLVRQRPAGMPLPFAFVSPAGEELAINDALFEVRGGGDRLELRYRGPHGDATKVFALGPDPLFTVEATLHGSDPWSLMLGPGVRNPKYVDLDNRYEKGARKVDWYVGGELEGRQADRVDAVTGLPSSVSWVALTDKYFITAAIPASPLASVNVVPVAVEQGEGGAVGGYRPLPASEEAEEAEWPRDLALTIEPAADRLALDAYFGTKGYVEMRRQIRAGVLPPGLDQTLDWGMFSFIAKPLLYGLRWLHQNVVHNYGWCIVLMTVLIKIALLPLTHKSYTSMQRMQKLNPRMEAIRNRYRPKLRDKQGRPNLEMQRKMNEEMQALFREEGVSPLGGCLPILIQMPIFFGFYQLLSNAFELWNAPWIGWIGDLTAKDPYYVLPLLMGATQFVSTKMMPAPTNPSQRIIMNTMPIWFTAISFGFPSGLVLYWLTNNVTTIIQQGGYNRLKKAGFFGGEPAKAALKTQRG
ncbi:MAG TPA: membrane protein insertase YidC [Thermoanaerobaculia bacterium]|nr:membrane protein insertase YidC [Thermoanaerobaculia bacterium]